MKTVFYMSKDLMRLSVFDKAQKVREFLKNAFQEHEDEQIMDMLCHVAHFQYDDRKRALTEDEMVMYKLLVTNGYNPQACYKWLLATIIPEDLKKRVDNKRITYKQAMRMKANVRKRLEAEAGLKILMMTRELIRSL